MISKQGAPKTTGEKQNSSFLDSDVVCLSGREEF